MNTNTGEIYHLQKGEEVPQPSVPLTLQEAKELEAIPNTAKMHNRARLRRYKQMHRDDDCRSCSKKLRFHTLKEFQVCYSE